MNKKSLNNKGFSLVELIIVMAIMAVLVGALAPQYVKYLDKSKVSVDTQVAGAVQEAMTITLLDPAIDDTAKPSADSSGKYGEGGTADFWNEINDIMGAASHDDLVSKLEYDTTTNDTTNTDNNVQIGYSIDTNGNVTVTITGGKYTSNNYDITVD